MNKLYLEEGNRCEKDYLFRKSLEWGIEPIDSLWVHNCYQVCGMALVSVSTCPRSSPQAPNPCRRPCPNRIRSDWRKYALIARQRSEVSDGPDVA